MNKQVEKLFLKFLLERAFLLGYNQKKDGSNKTRMLSHMSLGVISTKHGVRRTNLTII